MSSGLTLHHEGSVLSLAVSSGLSTVLSGLISVYSSTGNTSHVNKYMISYLIVLKQQFSFTIVFVCNMQTLSNSSSTQVCALRCSHWNTMNVDSFFILLYMLTVA